MSDTQSPAVPPAPLIPIDVEVDGVAVRLVIQIGPASCADGRLSMPIVSAGSVIIERPPLADRESA